MIKDPVAIILIIIGVLFWIKPLVVWFISMNNSFRGIQTNITDMTIWYYRIFGFASIVIGCIKLFGIRY